MANQQLRRIWLGLWKIMRYFFYDLDYWIQNNMDWSITTKTWLERLHKLLNFVSSIPFRLFKFPNYGEPISLNFTCIRKLEISIFCPSILHFEIIIYSTLTLHVSSPGTPQKFLSTIFICFHSISLCGKKLNFNLRTPTSVLKTPKKYKTLDKGKLLGKYYLKF